MTDKTYLEEFTEGVTEGLSKRLVKTFIECLCDPATKSVDVVTQLKDQMEQALRVDDDAAA